MSEEEKPELPHGAIVVDTAYGAGLTPDGLYGLLTFDGGDEPGFVTIAMPPEQVYEAIAKLCEIPSEFPAGKTKSVRSLPLKELHFEASPSGFTYMTIAFGTNSIVRFRLTMDQLRALQLQLAGLLEQMKAALSDGTGG